MTKGSIARRYAKALLALAREVDKIEQLGEQLASFTKVLEDSPELFDSIRNPAYPFEEKKAVILDILQKMSLDKLVQNFVLLVNDRRRIEHLPDMAMAYQELADELAERVRAVITTATELPKNQEDTIRAALSDKIGKTVMLSVKKDPDIIAGIIAQVGNLKLDYSLRNQLARVRSELAS